MIKMIRQKFINIKLKSADKVPLSTISSPFENSWRQSSHRPYIIISTNEDELSKFFEYEFALNHYHSSMQLECLWRLKLITQKLKQCSMGPRKNILCYIQFLNCSKNVMIILRSIHKDWLSSRRHPRKWISLRFCYIWSSNKYWFYRQV